MMLRVFLFLLFLFFTQDVFSQFYIRGRVTDNENQQALKGASVYINNSTRGTVTDDNGNFELGPLDAGHYEVVASYVGYDALLYTAEITTINFRISFNLDKKGTLLSEVLVLTKENREHYLEIFKRNLLGFTVAAKRCVISNIEEVQFASGKNKDEILAYTEKELVIDNPELGYTIYFELIDFYYNKFTSMTYFFGYSRYIDWVKDPQANKKLLRKRRQAYEGSILHFFRSLVNKQLSNEGFTVNQITAPQNIKKDSVVIIDGKMKNTPDGKRAQVIKVSEDSLLRLYSDSAYRVYELLLSDGLRIFYANNTDLKIEIIQKSLAGIQPQTGTFSGLRLRKAPVLISEKGTLLTPLGLYYDGVWAYERLANMLPEDYEVE